MPTWLLVLLLLPLGLWLAYCVLRSGLGFSACRHCIFAWFMVPGALGLWLVYSGLNEAVEIRVIFGDIIFATACIVGGLVYFAAHLSAQKRAKARAAQEAQQSDRAAAADAVALTGAAAVVAGGVGVRRPESDGSAEGPEAPDLDVGMDV